MTNTKRYTCRKVRDLLPLHVGGDLETRHVASVDEHLHECLSCFREFRELAELRGRLGVVGEAPLPSGVLDGFTDEVMARIALEEPGPAAELPRAVASAGTWTRIRAAAAVAVVALVGWKLWPADPAGTVSPASFDPGGTLAASSSGTTTMAGATPLGDWADLIGEAPMPWVDDATAAPTGFPATGAMPVDATNKRIVPGSGEPMLWRVHLPTPAAPKLRPLEGRVLRERER